MLTWLVLGVGVLALLMLAELRRITSRLDQSAKQFESRSTLSPVFSLSEIWFCAREIERLQNEINRHEPRHDGDPEKRERWVRDHAKRSLPEFLALVQPRNDAVCARKAHEELLERMIEINIAVSNGSMSLAAGVALQHTTFAETIYLAREREWKAQLESAWSQTWQSAQHGSQTNGETK